MFYKKIMRKMANPQDTIGLIASGKKYYWNNRNIPKVQRINMVQRDYRNNRMKDTYKAIQERSNYHLAGTAAGGSVGGAIGAGLGYAAKKIFKSPRLSGVTGAAAILGAGTGMFIGGKKGDKKWKRDKMPYHRNRIFAGSILARRVQSNIMNEGSAPKKYK